jgi:hypothetical protein
MNRFASRLLVVRAGWTVLSIGACGGPRVTAPPVAAISPAPTNTPAPLLAEECARLEWVDTQPASVTPNAIAPRALRHTLAELRAAVPAATRVVHRLDVNVVGRQSITAGGSAALSGPKLDIATSTFPVDVLADATDPLVQNAYAAFILAASSVHAAIFRKSWLDATVAPAEPGTVATCAQRQRAEAAVELMLARRKREQARIALQTQLQASARAGSLTAADEALLFLLLNEDIHRNDAGATPEQLTELRTHAKRAEQLAPPHSRLGWHIVYMATAALFDVDTNRASAFAGYQRLTNHIAPSHRGAEELMRQAEVAPTPAIGLSLMRRAAAEANRYSGDSAQTWQYATQCKLVNAALDAHAWSEALRAADVCAALVPTAVEGEAQVVQQLLDVVPRDMQLRQAAIGATLFAHIAWEVGQAAELKGARQTALHAYAKVVGTAAGTPLAERALARQLALSQQPPQPGPPTAAWAAPRMQQLAARCALAGGDWQLRLTEREATVQSARPSAATAEAKQCIADLGREYVDGIAGATLEIKLHVTPWLH